MIRTAGAVAGFFMALWVKPAGRRRSGALLALFFIFAPLAHAQSGVPVQEVVSPGGIRAWLVSDDTVPMIVLHAYWQGGSAAEEQRLTGLTSVLTEMMGEGAGNLDSAAFKTRLEELNMQLSFSSSWDGVSMSVVTLSENREAAFDLAESALTAPRFDAPPLERIKRQMQIGIRQRETNPSYLANLALDQALIPDHPYARRVSLESLAAMDRAALVRWRETLFARDRLMVTVVGDIEPAVLAAELDDLFGSLPAQGRPASLAPQAANIRPAVAPIVRPLPQPQSLILFAAPGIDDDDPDWIAAAIANYILGGGSFSSRLMDEVREERGLVYGISTTNSVRDGAAFVRGSAQTENAKVGEAIEVTRAEIARLYNEGPTQEEVDDAIRYLTGSFALSLDSNVGIAGVLFGYQTAGRDIGYINRRNALIEATTRDDVVRVIRRLYDPAKFTFVVVGQPAGLAPPGPSPTE